MVRTHHYFACVTRWQPPQRTHTRLYKTKQVLPMASPLQNPQPSVLASVVCRTQTRHAGAAGKSHAECSKPVQFVAVAGFSVQARLCLIRLLQHLSHGGLQHSSSPVAPAPVPRPLPPAPLTTAPQPSPRGPPTATSCKLSRLRSASAACARCRSASARRATATAALAHCWCSCASSLIV